MATTLEELAEMAGVSRATVSRVINGGPASPAARRRVQAAIEQSGYRPNLAARTLASGRSNTVAVAMHVDSHVLFQDPYFAQLLQGMSDVLADRDAGMMLWLGNRSKEETLEHILSFGFVDGVIATAHVQDDPLVDGLIASRLPVVLIGHRRAERNASYVDVDHAAAAEAVTEHLVGLGRRRIGHITGLRGTVAAEDRLEGYARAMARAGLPIDGLVVDGDFTGPAGAVGTARLLDAGVDAIFCANDASAFGALEVLRGRGLQVPGDVALAGFDDLAFAAHADPPLTTVRQGVREQGAEAARVLFRLVGDPDGGPRRVILPTELVVRASTMGGVPPSS
jgi:DNA-binding LacI/PurR family transcriptional regulator